MLLHALGDDSSSWEFVAAELSQFFRVVTLDFRGHGQSDRPGDYSFEVMRDDVLGLLDHLNLARTSVVGHSMGGTVAYLIAEAQPGRIDRLILEDTPPPFPESWSTPSRPEEPQPFDWAVVPAIIAQLNDPDPAWWDRLGDITASTLIIAGGPDSHVPQDKLQESVELIPTCELADDPRRPSGARGRDRTSSSLPSSPSSAPKRRATRPATPSRPGRLPSAQLSRRQRIGEVHDDIGP